MVDYTYAVVETGSNIVVNYHVEENNPPLATPFEGQYFVWIELPESTYFDIGAIYDVVTNTFSPPPPELQELLDYANSTVNSRMEQVISIAGVDCYPADIPFAMLIADVMNEAATATRYIPTAEGSTVLVTNAQLLTAYSTYVDHIARYLPVLTALKTDINALTLTSYAGIDTAADTLWNAIATRTPLSNVRDAVEACSLKANFDALTPLTTPSFGTAPNDATTNYNVVTTLLGALTGAVNTANTKQNAIADVVRQLVPVVASLVTAVNALQTAGK